MLKDMLASNINLLTIHEGVSTTFGINNRENSVIVISLNKSCQSICDNDKVSYVFSFSVDIGSSRIDLRPQTRTNVSQKTFIFQLYK